MSKRFFLVVLAVFGAQIISAPVLADQVTVTAQILPARTIYADSSDHLLRLVSNTPLNVAPTVMVNGTSSRMDTSLAAQYNLLLKTQTINAGVYSLPKTTLTQFVARQTFKNSLAKLEFY